jgi:hypothetical protein
MSSPLFKKLDVQNGLHISREVWGRTIMKEPHLLVYLQVNILEQKGVSNKSSMIILAYTFFKNWSW